LEALNLVGRIGWRHWRVLIEALFWYTDIRINLCNSRQSKKKSIFARLLYLDIPATNLCSLRRSQPAG
jgi:hypothetical protein